LREAFGIPSATFYDWEEKLDSGYYNTKTKRERKRKIDKGGLKREIAEKPDAYLRELAEKYGCMETAVYYALKKLKKKKKKRLLPVLKNPSGNGRSRLYPNRCTLLSDFT
jgi:transposase